MELHVIYSLHQPRSQGLSSLPPLVVGRKTLVAAGHVTTQNLGGKKWKTSYKHCINPLRKTKENPVENKVLTGVFQERGND